MVVAALVASSVRRRACCMRYLQPIEDKRKRNLASASQEKIFIIHEPSFSTSPSRTRCLSLILSLQVTDIYSHCRKPPLTYTALLSPSYLTPPHLPYPPLAHHLTSLSLPSHITSPSHPSTRDSRDRKDKDSSSKRKDDSRSRSRSRSPDRDRDDRRYVRTQSAPWCICAVRTVAVVRVTC